MHEVRSFSRLIATTFVGAALLGGCASHDDLGANFVGAGNPQINRSIGEGAVSYRVLGNGALAAQAAKHQVTLADDAATRELLERLARASNLAPASEPPPKSVSGAADSLVLGFPIGLLHESQVFGGVITGVSATKTEGLGDLKLSDLTPLHVRAEVVRVGDSGYALALAGCDKACTEGSEVKPLVTVPILGADAEQQYLLLDLASLGAGLNLIKMLDSDGSALHLTTKSSTTTAFDYSLSTLVFDVKVDMTPAKDAPKSVADTSFTVRWYLRLASAFDPSFEPRDATKGVGFFMTERAKRSRVERQGIPAGSATVKYYVLHVPEEYQSAFASAFDEWNDKFTAIMGKKIFSYEFVGDDDPRLKYLVTGDPRFHIVEWDLVNAASYGGLGPSIANQFTGEILTSNVLIQGPHIVEMYRKWFEIGKRMAELKARGQEDEADRLLLQTSREIAADEAARQSAPLALRLGSGLDFRIASQSPPLRDPAAQREDFDEIPPDVSYDDYMQGYFHDMLAHELGHNLGLRHNFHGSLDGSDPTKEGGVSDSVMEYLGRDFRYLDHIGTYDRMAIKYGYLGVEPEKRDLFCTDEDVPDAKHLGHSAECSPDDATQDPFSFLEKRLSHAVDLLVARGQSRMPEWNLDDMKRELPPVLKGLGYYAATAEKSAGTWTRFFGKGDRPKSADGVKAYVVGRVHALLCDPAFTDLLKSKESAEARAKTVANIEALNKQAAELLLPLEAFSADELKCDLK